MSQSRTRTGIIAIGIAMVAIGLGFSWLSGRSITRPLNGLVTVRKRLANGDTTTRIPATHAHDEIGEMARTVIVFWDSMIERERLTQTQTEASRAPERRGDTIASTIAQFKNSVETAWVNCAQCPQNLKRVRRTSTRPAAKLTEVAGRAVAQRTVTTMTELGNAATRIGEVVGLIQVIEGQTNLLALNATIEAAHAGIPAKRLPLLRWR